VEEALTRGLSNASPPSTTLLHAFAARQVQPLFLYHYSRSRLGTPHPPCYRTFLFLDFTSQSWYVFGRVGGWMAVAKQAASSSSSLCICVPCLVPCLDLCWVWNPPNP